MMPIIWFAGAYGIAAVGVVAGLVPDKTQQGWRSEAVFWALVCIACLLLMAGVLPWFWRIPFVAKVQFPWRLMLVVEFAAITALCLTPWPARTRAISLIVIAAIITLVPGVGMMASGIRLRVQASLAEQDPPQDLRQFLPAGFPRKPNLRDGDLGLEPFRAVPTIACTPEPRICRITNELFGTLSVEIDADAPIAVVLRRFYFPVWRLDPTLPLMATDPLRLMSFTAPVGRHVYHLQRVVAPEEKAGWAISGLSFALLLAWAAAAWRGVRRA
jgi:hypothetical protein